MKRATNVDLAIIYLDGGFNLTMTIYLEDNGFDLIAVIYLYAVSNFRYKISKGRMDGLYQRN